MKHEQGRERGSSLQQEWLCYRLTHFTVFVGMYCEHGRTDELYIGMLMEVNAGTEGRGQGQSILPGAP